MNASDAPRFWYVATPYTKYEGGLDAAFADACEWTARLLASGVSVFSPIVHSHPIAMAGRLDPLSHDFWMRVDAPFMEAAYGLIVVRLPGWEDSKGVQAEIGWFKQRGRPIRYVGPES